MSEALTPVVRRAVVLDIANLAREKYVYPDIGEKLAESLRAKFESGGYDAMTDAGELALTLTEDLKAVSKDQHWNVAYDPHQATAHIDPETEEGELARWLAQARSNNFGFVRVERLQGNIGYIDLHEFAPSEYAGETAVAAMGFVAHCDALIFDLRENYGGHPSMVQLITSYLVDPKPRHINTFYYRPTDDYQQFWTFPHIPGQRLPDVPVYVLISPTTGSGAEEFAYNLKHMKRGTLVGETTTGAAHPITTETVQDHFKVRLPYGRPINPITKENWEGTGVEPHISVSQEEALKTAHLHAMAHLTESCQDAQQKRALTWDMEIVESLYTPVHVAEATLARYAGHYGKRSFAVEDGALMYKHPALPTAWRLTPLSATRFRLDEVLKFEFVLDKQGTVSAVSITYQDGRPELTIAKTA
jgi:hypothetical protein